jgi:hypothetical protein
MQIETVFDTAQDDSHPLRGLETNNESQLDLGVVQAVIPELTT